MKKTFIWAFLLIAVSARSQTFLSVEEILERWPDVVIPNAGDGSLPAMLRAFDKTWPTKLTSDARSVIDKGLSEKVLDKETGYTVCYDAKNGYAEVYDDGADNGYMQTCYWRRSNGHRLFAITLGYPVDSEQELMCFYDYDPQTRTMTPEPDILSGLPRKTADIKRHYSLPQQGKDMYVNDFKGLDARCLHFTWDGMKPVLYDSFDKSVGFDAPEEDSGYDIPVSYSGSGPGIADFVSACFSDDQLPELMGSCRDDWRSFRQGKPLPKNHTLLLDSKNGYMRYESAHPQYGARAVVEMCYWNCSDGYHKLVARNIVSYANGKRDCGQFDGLNFFLFDPDERAMKLIGFEECCEGGFPETPNAETVTFVLPREGKTVLVLISSPSGEKRHRMEWNGNGFIYLK